MMLWSLKLTVYPNKARCCFSNKLKTMLLLQKHLQKIGIYYTITIIFQFLHCKNRPQIVFIFTKGKFPHYLTLIEIISYFLKVQKMAMTACLAYFFKKNCVLQSLSLKKKYVKVSISKIGSKLDSLDCDLTYGKFQLKKLLFGKLC